MKDIKKDLFDKGRELFSKNGFKNTNISDITKAAGIGTGTFYNYFSSKEELFMAIYLNENEKLKRSILGSVNLDEEPLILVKKILALNEKGMNANPILKEWFNTDVFSRIERHFREKNGLRHVHFMYDSFAEIIKRWQAEGKMRNDIDSGLIMAMFTALTVIDTHKEEIGLPYFPQILDRLTEFTMRGLTDYPG